MFAPSVFSRGKGSHLVHKQPDKENEKEVDLARAALQACPVAAIRVDRDAAIEHQEGLAETLSTRKQPSFPRPLFDNDHDINVFFVGHHNSASFGATPYLVKGKYNNNKQQHNNDDDDDVDVDVDDDGDIWVMVDTPKFSPSAVRAVVSLTGPNGPDYLFLTHVDDTADHGKWADRFPNLKQIFHEGDLGPHNWIGDETLEDVNVLLRGTSSASGLVCWDLDGNRVTNNDSNNSDNDFLIVHTPGHSPGSISLLVRQSVFFTGDTYAYSTRGNAMSGFPRYGNDLKEQARILNQMLEEFPSWSIVAPGHGHPRNYNNDNNQYSTKKEDMQIALQELQQWY
mmetsp:Transcript_20219/g.30760  ORF Transcript_20219/g.30760 Transcript_20219/m.30760 type:complete len:340 (+) Transcript_20219:80-1099(+)